jgi:curved DNA-binding protein
MPIKYKDYYEVLGVGRTANQEEIKQAFRKLARKCHPDVSGGKAGAEERFKEINEAYEVLKDPAKRRKYDAMGLGIGHEREFRPPQGWGETAGWSRSREPPGAGFNLGGTGFSDFFETFFGSRRVAGDPFFGGGAGMGFHTTGSRRGSDLEADIMVTLEEAVHGSRRQVSVDRGGWAGRGQVEVYQVTIPPGVHQGQRIRLAGKGEQGSGPGAPPGDLYLRVRLSEHPFFRVEESDLYYDVSLAPWQAVLGDRVEVPTPSDKVVLRIPPGTSSGRRFRLRQQGLPRGAGRRGDMYVVAQIESPQPQDLPPEERRLWAELARISKAKRRR